LTTSVLIPLIRTRFISRFYRVFFRPIARLEKISLGHKADTQEVEVVENNENSL